MAACELRTFVEEIVKKYVVDNNLSLLRDDVAGKCWDRSIDLMKWLNGLGIHSEVIGLSEWKGGAIADIAPMWAAFGPEGHYVLRVDDVYVDLTAQQFGEQYGSTMMFAYKHEIDLYWDWCERSLEAEEMSNIAEWRQSEVFPI